MRRLSVDHRGRTLRRILDSDNDLSDDPNQTRAPQVSIKRKAKPFIARDESELEYDTTTDEDEENTPTPPRATRTGSTKAPRESPSQHIPTEEEDRAERALIRILYTRGWTGLDIAAELDKNPKVVQHAVQNIAETSDRVLSAVRPGRDDTTQDYEVVDLDKLRDLMMVEGPKVRNERERRKRLAAEASEGNSESVEKPRETKRLRRKMESQLSGDRVSEDRGESIESESNKEEGTAATSSRHLANSTQREFRDPCTHADRALCRILYNTHGWEPPRISRELHLNSGTVWHALRNSNMKRIRGQKIPVSGRDDTERDDEVVDAAVLQRLVAPAGASHPINKRKHSAAVGDSEEETSDSDVVPHPRKRQARHTHGERALCRVLFHTHRWKQSRISRALGMHAGVVSRAVHNLGLDMVAGKSRSVFDHDDLARDKDVLDRSKLAKLIGRDLPDDEQPESPESEDSERDDEPIVQVDTEPVDKDGVESIFTVPVADEPVEVVAVQQQTQRQQSRCSEEVDDNIDGRSITKAGEKKIMAVNIEPTGDIEKALEPEEAVEIHCEVADSKGQIEKFLSSAISGVNLSVHAALLIERGLDSMEKIAGLNKWDEADIAEALELWFGQDETGKSILSHFELAALREAIRKQ
ncbi:hypothetical protein MKEN_01001800 [Mycena kentingensis (nom. inval.)]|nr:hypothetical protein MKEN_01001800 [Mycena kentingensis (nom. inval.)]